jgi:hypothetical protein
VASSPLSHWLSADKEESWRSFLANLAALVEAA